MPPRFSLLLLPFLCLSAHAQNAATPRLSLSSEEPSGVFYDRDTLVPQTPILLSAKVDNPATEAKDIELAWKITDAGGTIRWQRAGKFSVGARGSIVRRELFDVPARGGYLLEVRTVSRLKGPDAQMGASLPFAVAPAPNPGATTGARPRSFFVLSAPAALSGAQLDFYSRLGARVLRSPLPANPDKPDWPGVESILGERLKRNLSSIALLDLGDETRSKNEAFWARQVPASLAKYRGLTTWELAGDVAPADLDAWAQVARSRRSDVSLLAPLSGLGMENLGSVRPRAVNDGQTPLLDGATFEWPSANQTPTHPAALRRLWLSRALLARGANVGAFHLRRESENARQSPLRAAGELTADYLSAIMAGASTMAQDLAPPAKNLAGARSMARGVAFSMLSRTLEDASFREELFPKSPALEGALFRAPRGAIAVLYAPVAPGRMTLRVAPAQVFDVFGNAVASAKDGKIEFRVGSEPVYIAADVETDVLSYALKSAQLAGIPSVEAQLLPLSREVGLSGPGSATIRLRVQNIGVGSARGTVELDAPKGWKLARERYDLELGEGESKTFEFRALTTTNDPKWTRGVPFGVSVKAGGRNSNWRMLAPVASARNVSPGEAPQINGNLSDWSGTKWMEIAPNAAGVGGRVGVKWDASYLYFAAQVKENALVPRNPEAANYDFWRGYDAIQIGFGLTNGPETLPTREPFRDANRGFLLSPFHLRAAGNIEGRVLKLWSPDVPYGSVTDHIRWGGAIGGAQCAVGRDEAGGFSSYEAKIPLAALPELKPQDLAARDGVVRFGFLVHNNEGLPLDWGASTGNFVWWDNPTTFLPPGILTSALRSTLGFSLSGEINGSPALAAPPFAPARNPTPPAPRPLPVSPMPLPAPPAPRSIPNVPPRPIPFATPRPVPPPRPRPRPTPRAVPNLPPPSGPLMGSSAGDSGFLPPTPPSQIPPFVVPPATLEGANGGL